MSVPQWCFSEDPSFTLYTSDMRHLLTCFQRDFYRTFGRPIAKVFLGAMATYQILYLGWSKLESIEEQQQKEG